MGQQRRVLVLTGGHRYDAEALDAMMGALAEERDWVVAHARQPGGQQWLSPAHHGAFDGVILHDIPGLHLRLGEAPRPVGPTREIVDAVADLLELGIGVVALHHALAGWPGWPGWAEVLGGRFHYRPATLRGEDWPDSGYWHGIFEAAPIGAHPVVDGVTSLALDDELYCAPVFEAQVRPLMRLANGPAREEFRSAYDAVLQRPQRADWDHPRPSDLVAWATVAGRSPVVSILPGEHGTTFADPAYRRLLGNAVDWVASPEARAEAADASVPVDRSFPSHAGGGSADGE